MRRNLLAPAFWIAPDARELARRGERLLADGPAKFAAHKNS